MTMMLPDEGYLLRIFIGESDRHDGKLLHEWIVTRARAEGLAGATVLRGMLGFGAHSRLHTFKIERLSQDLPIIVEIVDTREKLEKFLELIDHTIEEGMATLEEVTIHFYRSGKSMQSGQEPPRGGGGGGLGGPPPPLGHRPPGNSP